MANPHLQIHREADSGEHDARAPALVIGVLGGIASGKSEVARALAGARGEVLDADALARAALGSTEVRERLVARFGEAALTSAGEVDRAHLARRVFTDSAARRELESWVHPRVRAGLRRRLEAARARGATPIVLDVPLLLENDSEHHLVAECDALVFVEAAPQQRESRAAAARGWPAGEVARRETVQLPLETKRARADFVLVNTGELEALRAAARALVPRIQARRAAR